MFCASANAAMHPLIMNSTAASKRVGQMESISSAVWGAQTRALMWPLYERKRQNNKSAALSPALRWALEDFNLHLDLNTHRHLYSLAVPRPCYVACSDARGAVGGIYGSEHLGGAILPRKGESSKFFPALMHAPVSHYSKWLPPARQEDSIKQRINECESLAALVTLATFAELLTSSDILWVIDSSAAEGTLRKGYSSSRFLTALAGEFWRLASSRNIRIWLYRVPSKLNLADPISRVELNAFTSWSVREAAELDPSNF